MNFNSIKVQLELAMPKPLNFCSCYFNSIKVQLERPRPFSAYRDSLFQFHKGTIRTYI